MKVDFKKTVIIGASGGIGRELALTFAPSSSSMVLHGKSPEKLESLKTQLLEKASQKEIITFPFDFNSNFFYFDSIEKKELLEIVESADTLCVCFGPFLQKKLDSMTSEDWISVSNLVFALPGFLTSLALPHMIQQKDGRILLFGGTRTDSVLAYKTNPAYGAAKTAVCSLVKSIASEYGQYGIRCNGILPGFTETEYVSFEEKEHYKELLGSETIINSKNIAESADFLLKNPDINGVLLRIDRGWGL